MSILVDTCIGNDKDRSVPAWNHLQTDFLDDLKTAGKDREEIDRDRVAALEDEVDARDSAL